jgi:general secretion pathway protein C
MEPASMIILPMKLLSNTVWLSRVVTFGLALAAGVSAAYWAMQWVGQAPDSGLAIGPSQSLVTTDTVAVARALGGAGLAGAPAEKASPLAASRFDLVGVVAVGTEAGAALISVDGTPARPFEVGTKVGDAWVLHSVKPRQAVLVRPAAADGQVSAGDAGLVLQMPPLTEANLGQ